jgi:hypothetical protein
MSFLNHEAPTIFKNIWYPLSKLGVTVEVRSFDGICLLHSSLDSTDDNITGGFLPQLLRYIADFTNNPLTD